jgi:hypothetical protein
LGLKNKAVWRDLVSDPTNWVFRGSQLAEKTAVINDGAKNPKPNGLAKFILTNIYGRLNRIAVVRRIVGDAVFRMAEGEFGPRDFCRFSKKSNGVLLSDEKWAVDEKEITAGHGSGLHRILTEFLGVHFSISGNRIYKLSQGLSVLLFRPLMLFDLITNSLPERDRIASG